MGNPLAKLPLTNIPNVGGLCDLIVAATRSALTKSGQIGSPYRMRELHERFDRGTHLHEKFKAESVRGVRAYDVFTPSESAIYGLEDANNAFCYHGNIGFWDYLRMCREMETGKFSDAEFEKYSGIDYATYDAGGMPYFTLMVNPGHVKSLDWYGVYDENVQFDEWGRAPEICAQLIYNYSCPPVKVEDALRFTIDDLAPEYNQKLEAILSQNEKIFAQANMDYKRVKVGVLASAIMGVAIKRDKRNRKLQKECEENGID